MITKITLNNCFVLFLSFTFCAFSHAQTKEYATSISSENHVIGSNNSIDSNLATKADIEANSGIALGIGAYSGHLELEYPAPLTANTTTYIKFETEDDLLSSLLGGNLGNLLSNISGVLLQGNQEFTIEAKNGSNTVLQGDSNVPTGFSTNDLRVVVNGSNDYFLVVTPSDTYDRINLTNKVGSLISLNNTRNLNVYGAFYTEGNSSCGLPAYTSFDGNGLTLDLLNIGGAGVTNPNLAIDGDPGTFSQMGLGLIGIAADIEQTIYFDTPSNALQIFKERQ